MDQGIAPDWGDRDGTNTWVAGETILTRGQIYASEARNIGWHAAEQRTPWLQDLAGLEVAARDHVARYGDDIVTVVEAIELLETRYGDPRWPPRDMAATLIGILVVRQIHRWILEEDPDGDIAGFTATAVFELGLDEGTPEDG